MAFTLNLYQTNSDPRQVTKSLTSVAANIPIQPTATLDILNPNIIINYNESYLNANYCYCSLLNRYYYITSTSLEIGKRIILNCAIDVLHTYSSQIRSCTACVVRNEGIGKPTYIPDNQLPIHPSEQDVTSIRFSESPFTTGALYAYILTVLRGDNNASS